MTLDATLVVPEKKRGIKKNNYAESSKNSYLFVYNRK